MKYEWFDGYELSEDELANEFVVYLINSVMEKFKATYEQVDNALEKMDLWVRLNDSSVALVGARGDIDKLIDEIGEYL